MDHLDDTFAISATLILGDGARYAGRAVVIEEHDRTTERKLVRGTFWFDGEGRGPLLFGDDEEAILVLEGGRELEVGVTGGSSGTQPSWADFLDRRNIRK